MEISTEVVETPIDVVAPANVEPKPKRSIKVVRADGSISYGFKKDGTPRKAPGRKPKAIVE